jgi:hypothetical protein
MQRLNNRRGSSVVGVIAAVVALILVAGGIWFLVSKPFHQQVKGALTQATQWTPENIKADPVGYLTYALEEVGRTEKKLQASELGLRTKKNAASRQLEKYTADKSDYEKLLADLKDAYSKASADNKWPTRFRNVEIDEKGMKRKIVECAGKIKNTGDLLETYSKSDKMLGDKLDEIESKMSDVEKLKSKLSTNIEMAKATESVEDIGSIGDQLNSIVDTSSALAKTADEANVDQLIKPSGDAKVDDEFSKIMGKK